jgi:hypothetical protein
LNLYVDVAGLISGSRNAVGHSVLEGLSCNSDISAGLSSSSDDGRTSRQSAEDDVLFVGGAHDLEDTVLDGSNVDQNVGDAIGQNEAEDVSSSISAGPTQSRSS